MKNDWYQTGMHYWNKWRQEQPLWVIGAVISAVLLIYYLLVVVSLNHALVSTQKSIATDKKNVEWMAKASQTILRLPQSVLHQKTNNNETVFALVNQSITNQRWSNFVTAVHQVDEQQVQVDFKSISFNELITWLIKLYDQSDVYVTEADLKKIQPNVVSATLILKK